MSNKIFSLKRAISAIAIAAIIENASAGSPGSITITIVDGGYQYPDVVIPIVTMHEDGSLNSLDGKELNNSDLEKLLRRAKTVAGKETCLIRLHSDKEVSMQTLGKGLRRIQSLKSLELPTVIYVYSRELLPLDGEETGHSNEGKK
jgi:hypothetical protein